MEIPNERRQVIVVIAFTSQTSAFRFNEPRADLTPLFQQRAAGLATFAPDADRYAQKL